MLDMKLYNSVISK